MSDNLCFSVDFIFACLFVVYVLPVGVISEDDLCNLTMSLIMARKCLVICCLHLDAKEI